MTLASPSPRQFHRKFIAVVLALSVAVTGFGAAPARADGEDIAKIIAGLAVLGIVGAAINDRKHERRDPPHTAPILQPHPRPVPPHVRRYDLPAECLTNVRSRGWDRSLLGLRCLDRNYRHADALPRACYIEIDERHGDRHGYSKYGRDRHGVRAGYRPECLRQYGYRLVHR